MLASTNIAAIADSDYRKLSDERCANSDFRGAIEALKQDVASRKRADSVGISDSLILQGNVLRLAGDYKAAAKLIATGIRMLEANTKQSDTPSNAKRLSAAYNYLALLDNNQGYYAKSESNARKALRLAQAAMLGEDVAAMHCVVLANALRQQGKYDEALTILAPAVETLKTSPGNAVLLGTATNNLGALFFWMGNYPKALVTLNEGLALRIAATGAEHPDVANSLIDLGCTEFKLDQAEKARGHLEQSLAIRRSKLGNTHPDTLASMAALAVVYQSMARTKEALGLLEQAVANGEKVLGTIHPDLAHYKTDYASILATNNQIEKARKYQTEAVRIEEAAFGFNSREYANGLRMLADILQANGQVMRAAQLLERSIAILERNKQSPDADYAGCLEDLAAIEVDRGHLNAAGALLTRAVAVRTGPPSIDQAILLANLADVLERLNRQKESRQALKKAKVVVDALPQRQKGGPEYASITDRCKNLPAEE